MLDTLEVAPVNVGLKEACRITGLGKTTIYELVKGGTLTIRKYGAKTLFDYAEVCAFARSIPAHSFNGAPRRPQRQSNTQQQSW